ncbi:MAG: hypothetical protein ACRDSR_02825 [Pseudonocardiaceae bacterium]
MSTEAESFVFGPQGPVHTGTGHQFIGLEFLQGLVRAGRDPRAVPREHLPWLHRRFVEPHRFGRARESLAKHRSVLLTGAPGSGRRAAAQMLLYRLPGAEIQIRELPDGDPDKPELDAKAVDSGQRLLLDLSTGEETFYAMVLELLSSYRHEVRDRGAHLIVVLPHSRKHYLGSEFGSSVVDIVRPKGREVFRRYLRFDDITRDAQLDADQLTLLRSEPMQRIAELAGLVRLAQEAEPKKELQHWLSQAFTAWTTRSDEVATQVKALHSGQQRALLLASAMFSGAHADAIFDSTSKLCRVIQHPADDRPRLEQEGFAERLAEIGGETDVAGRVHFKSLAYDRAVRTYFWVNRPDLREDFRKWVGTALGHPTLSSEDRDKVVTRFAQQALRTDRPHDLRLLAEHWVKRSNPSWPSRLLPQTARAVECGLNDERHGLFFRQQLYTWSRNPNLSPDLAQVVVQVCSEVLALTYPRQAVVRLHHIVRRHSGAPGEAARNALLRLIDGDYRRYCFLLERVTNDRRADEGEAADLALFLDLADPALLTDSQRRDQPLIADETVRDQLVTGWNAVLSGPLGLRCANRVQTWLACENDGHRELLLDVLVSAGDGRHDLLSRLYGIGDGWAHAPGDHREARAEIAGRLNDKIDFAQGIDFTELDLSTEGTSP